MFSWVLGSASPRRRALLASVNLHPPVRPADVDESIRHGELPPTYGQRVAADKARAVLEMGETQWVLSADTVVDLEGRSLGKAERLKAAEAFLNALSGRIHEVHTAVVLASRERLYSELITTKVRFRTLSPSEIERYLKTQEPLGKAGGYAIQGEGGALVAELHGSYTNVVGLPLEQTLRLLSKAGLT